MHSAIAAACEAPLISVSISTFNWRIEYMEILSDTNLVRVNVLFRLLKCTGATSVNLVAFSIAERGFELDIVLFQCREWSDVRQV